MWPFTRKDDEWDLLDIIFGPKVQINEYTLRYNKVHKCQNVISYFMNNINEVANLPNLGLTKPALAMPEQYKRAGLSLESAVESYRAYYLGEKWQDANGNRMDNWTMRNPPIWWTNPESRGLV